MKILVVVGAFGGVGRFYLYDGEGRLKNEGCRTVGLWQAMSCISIRWGARPLSKDMAESRGSIRITGFFTRFRWMEAPLFVFTPGDGHHSIDIAPGGKCFYDRWSRMNMPEKRRIADLSGRTLAELPEADLSEVRAKGSA